MNREVNGLLEGVIEKLDEAVLVEAHQDLIDLMEDVGYELDAETLGEALEAVSAFMESEEFYALSEEEQSKIKKGFKMVFGKLRKLGDTAKALGGELKTKRGRQLAGAFIKSGLAKQMASDALSKAFSKSKLGKGFEKVGGAVVKGIDKVTGGAASKAIVRKVGKNIANRKAATDKYVSMVSKK